MESLEDILVEEGYQVCEDGFQRPARAYRSHVHFQPQPDATKVKMILTRTYPSHDEIVLLDHVRGIDKLTATLAKLLKSEPQLALTCPNRQHFCRSELYCSKCEATIHQRVTWDAFDSYPGFIAIQTAPRGRCVLSVDAPSARKITERLVTLRNCEQCNNSTAIPPPPNTQTWTH